jgi:hypothetical protein
MECPIWGVHLSYDYTRERQLASAAAFAAQVARRHAAAIDTMFSALAEGNEGQPTPPAEITAVLWASYLGHLTTHLTSIVGKEATTSILKQVLAAHIGDERDH